MKLLALASALALATLLSLGAAEGVERNTNTRRDLARLGQGKGLLRGESAGVGAQQQSRRELAVSAGAVRLQNFLGFLRNNKIYSHFIANLESSGFNNTLANFLNGYKMTILVPNNFATFPNVAPKQMAQVLGLHVWFNINNYASLVNAPKGHGYLTADLYPSAKISAYKLKTSVMMFNGNTQAISGAPILLHNFYSDGFILAHSTNRVMAPIKLY